MAPPPPNPAPNLEAGPYGPLNALQAAVRRRAPQITAHCAHLPDNSPEIRTLGKPAFHLYVTYLDSGPRRISWDDHSETYVWSTGPDNGRRLDGDVERAAEKVAEALGAPIIPPPGATGRWWRPRETRSSAGTATRKAVDAWVAAAEDGQSAPDVPLEGQS